MAGQMVGVTLRDVAQAAGVSVSTASRALTGRGDLTTATRHAVLSVAGELGYRPGRKGHDRPAPVDSRLIELVLGTFDDAWSSPIIVGARKGAFASGYDLVLTLDREDAADDWPGRIARRRPSGVILGVIKPTRVQLRALSDARVPIVLLDPMSDPHGELPSVGTTDWQGGYDAGAHLAASGLTRFVFVAGVPRYRFGKAREEGFRAAIHDACAEAVIARIDGDWGSPEVTREFAAAVRQTGTPVGVFASNDELALAVYRAAERLRLTIPDDVSVVGFNDLRRVAGASPPMTSVLQPLEAMAGRAVQLIGELRSGRHQQPYERVELPTRLVVRQSTLPPVSAAGNADRASGGGLLVGGIADNR